MSEFDNLIASIRAQARSDADIRIRGAEMSYGVSVGYEVLYPSLSEAAKERIREAAADEAVKRVHRHLHEIARDTR